MSGFKSSGSATAQRSPKPKPRRKDLFAIGAVCALLAVIVWVVFGTSIQHEFINYDDDHYVYNEPKVIDGLSPRGIYWAFTHSHADNWHPLTTISHMLDVQLYGLNAPGHHFTNVLLHAIAAILLFLALCRLTTSAVTGIGDAGRDQRSRLQLYASAFVAAIFAVHPLRVESVAWVAERKDVLSGVFFGLTLLTYASYARRQQFSRYVAVVTFFALGLMCKPTLVTVPFVLLLLDYWPLRRMQIAKGEVRSLETGLPAVALAKAARLVVEKIPLFILSAASCVITTVVQTQAVAAIQGLPLQQRLANAAISYVTYLRQSIYPIHLSILYPYPQGRFPITPVVLASLFLLIISMIVVAWRERHRYLFTGWFWYLGMMVPMIGLVQVGSQAHADRYTYLPQIGLWVMATWGVVELSAIWRIPWKVLGTVAGLIIVVMSALSRREISNWKNGETLWTHAIQNTSGNYIAHNNFANWLLQRGRLNEAEEQSRQALGINADLEEGHVTLGNIFFRTGHPDSAMAEYRIALQRDPEFSEVRSNLGNILMDQGRITEAITEYETALKTSPDHVAILSNLGNALVKDGRGTEAIPYFQKAIEINPKFPEAQNNLGNALFQLGKVEEAIPYFRSAIALKPDFPQAEFNLGNALMREGNNEEAIRHYQRSLEIKSDNADAQYNLAKAYAAVGDYNAAIGASEAAIRERPNYLPAYNNLGCFFGAIGKTDDAVAAFSEALKIDANFVDARYNLGRLLAQLGRKQEAIEQLKQVLQVNPDYSDTKQRLAELGVPVSQ